ncbi:DUF1430 domain-containing protein [Bacillus thuringiensis]|uniref:DUF1430 domain-containing protein n=1 Tax=Bacillus thuringiensis TaxID=1428 RepID=UPI000BFB362D|nr:DUF1430 domain-containing protein [Bacillus thuringiensis]PGU93679.1 hypothetical protein COD69_26860 [Bacillus thuringiensis]
MKKILYVLLTLVLISVNLFGYFLMSNKQLYDFLYTNNQLIHIDYSKAEKEIKDNELLEHMIKFSNDKKISIFQYKFQSEIDLNIYSTNIKNNPNIHLESGQIPMGTDYLSNENLDSNNNNLSGIFSFPLSNWKIHIYDMQQIHNVGLGDEFYLNGANKEIINNFIKEFSRYGEISLINENINSLVLINISLLMVVIFSFVIFFIGLFYFLIQNRKKMLLQQIWGYSTWLVLFSVPKIFLRFFILIISLLLLGMAVFILAFNQTYFVIDYIIMFVLTNVITIFILLLFTMVVTWFIKKFNNDVVNIKGKLPFRKIQWISAILKVVVSIILFGVISSSLINFDHLSKKIEGLKYWNQTQDVFRIQVGRLNDDINNNLKLDRDLNNRLFDLYKEIELNNKAFLMVSDNFHIVNDDNGKSVYSYTRNISDESKIYSPKGRNVIINKNYLDVNPIKGINRMSIHDQIQNDENILNILVPEQFKKLENRIVASYKQWFYFQKVHVNNIYNQELGYSLNQTTMDDLTINIIYTKPEQNYFTFKSDTGDSKNRIKDPIAIIYNESLDTSTIGSYATTSLFFIDKSKGNAFENILTTLNKTHVTEVNNVLSVYNEANDQIVKQQWLLFQQIIGLIITIIFSVILFGAFIWAYYNANVYQLNLKYLFGYSYWKRNKSIVLVTLISNVIAGLLVYLFYGVTIVFLVVILFLIIDLVVINTLSNYLNKKNINKVLKGDHI